VWLEDKSLTEFGKIFKVFLFTAPVLLKFRVEVTIVLELSSAFVVHIVLSNLKATSKITRVIQPNCACAAIYHGMGIIDDIDERTNNLLFLLLVSTFLLLGSSGSALTLYATRASTTVWRGESKVNVLLGVETNDEGRHVDNLLANAA
jgi:hypothetical protein